MNNSVLGEDTELAEPETQNAETEVDVLSDLEDVFAHGEAVDVPDDVKGREIIKSVDEPHLMFASEDLNSILKVVHPAKSAGSNIYDKSVLIRRTDDPGHYEFVFFSFGVRYVNVLKSSTPSPENLATVPVVVDIDSLATAVRFSGAQVLFYVRDRGLFSSLFGGEAFLTSYLNSDLSPFDPDEREKENPVPVDVSAFSGALSISQVGKSSQTAQQKILFFTPEGSYINAGGVFIQYASRFPDFALQPRAVAVLRAYFNLGLKEVNFSVTEHNLFFSSGRTSLTVEKVVDVLPDSSKQLFNGIPTTLTQVSLQVLDGISQVISSSNFEGGVLDVHVFGEGVKIYSKAKDGSRLSNFTLGAPTGNARNLSIAVSAMKSTLSLYKGQMNVSIGIKDDDVIFRSGNITALVAGREG